MWNKIREWINKLALMNFVTPRRAVTAFLVAISDADLDRNGELNAKELFKNMRKALKALIFGPDYTDEQIHKAIDDVLKPQN